MNKKEQPLVLLEKAYMKICRNRRGQIIQIKVKGEFTVSEARQALFEKLQELEDDYAVRHVRNLSLYLTPTNGFGDEVVPHNTVGQKVDKLYSKGPYKSAADDSHL